MTDERPTTDELVEHVKNGKLAEEPRALLDKLRDMLGGAPDLSDVELAVVALRVAAARQQQL
jgi:hypothetical protein